MNDIFLPESMWLCYAGDSKDDSPLAYLTHLGDDKAFEKRQGTGLSWAHNSEKRPAVQTALKNVPRSGFKILQHQTRYSTSNVVWRVSDPHGFTVEIYSDNMAALINDTLIDQGEVQGDCVWGRTAGKNFLISTNSDDYDIAQKVTKQRTTEGKFRAVKMKDLDIGDVVLVRSGGGIEYRYLGKQFLYEWNDGEWVRKSDKKRMVYFNEESKSFMSYASNTISLIVKKDPIDVMPLMRRCNQDAFDREWKQLEYRYNSTQVDGPPYTTNWFYMSIVHDSDVTPTGVPEFYRYTIEPWREHNHRGYWGCNRRGARVGRLPT